MAPANRPQVSRSRSLLDRPVQYLRLAGPRRAELFEKLDVKSGRDLLYHVPRRYWDATNVDQIADLATGTDATIIGRVQSTAVFPTRRRLKIFRALVEDPSGGVECAWPGQPFMERVIKKGDLVLLSGSVRFFHGRQLQPREHVVLERADKPGVAPVGTPEGIVFPVYPATQGLSHREIRMVTRANLAGLLTEIDERDPVPPKWLKRLGLPSLGPAFRALHAPRSLEHAEKGRLRLAFDEFLCLQLVHARARRAQVENTRAISFTSEPELTERFLQSLPFTLTGAQTKVWREIREDLARSVPMNRLLQGDVGCGKTVVAALAMLRAAESGHQAAVLAPTAVLAEQHRATLEQLTEPLGDRDLRPVLLTGSVTGQHRKYAQNRMESGQAKLIVGTHALLEDTVRYRSLGLVVIDEQHRFGVRQRAKLRKRNPAPHALIMSATPIPRSLAMLVFGDLDASVIDERPPARQTVTTAVRGPDQRADVLDFVQGELDAGGRAYIVYPLIEESEVLDVRAAKAGFEEMRKRFPGASPVLMHGALPSAEKDRAMRRFQSGESRLLVSTTVIEVGIDVPEATVMVIEDAERFGLAQLHQLRGRVGRGSDKSWCIALHAGRSPSERLGIFAATYDGFELAEQDLKLRGQGDLWGTAQHGGQLLRFARLSTDGRLLRAARRLARNAVAKDPTLSSPEMRPLLTELKTRYAEQEALFGVG